jgi:hypothetical protein
MKNIFELLNIILMIQKMLFILFITFTSMCIIAYLWRVKLIREIKYYKGVDKSKKI